MSSLNPRLHRRDAPFRLPRRHRPSAVAFHYTQTDSFAALLQQLGASLLVSTYQANKLLVARAAGGGLSMLVRTFDRPMGLAVDARRLMIGTRDQIWLLRNAPDIAPRIEPAGQHDACYLPRSCHVTGDIGVHEMAWAGDELWVVNTRFSCLCTLDPDYSFVPRWRPPFITALAAEDRCHLNGLAIVDGRPRYVTALGETDTAGGWRANKPQGGCLLDVRTGEIDQPRPVDAALAALARRPALDAGIGHGAARAGGPRHGTPAGRGRTARLRPRPGAVRPVCLRRPFQDSKNVRDGRRAAGRAAGAAQVRRGGRGPAQRPNDGLAGVPDGGGGDLRRATLARRALPRSDRFPARDDPAHVHRSA